MLYLAQLTGLVFVALIIGEVAADCPAELNDLVLDPPELVVRYGDPVSVTCSSLSNYTQLNWTVPLGIVYDLGSQNVTWETDNLTDWEVQPVCYMILDDVRCNKTLPITIYKPPDRVLISTVGHTGPMTEGKPYELQCDIQNVSPVHLLSVNWYKGPDLVNTTNFTTTLSTNISTKIPVYRSTRLKIIPSRDDEGVRYICEAKLNLVPNRPQLPPIMTSEPLIITKVEADCPAALNDLVLDPPELVVRYGDPVSVSCRSLSNYTQLNWRVPLGTVLGPENQTVTWETDNLTDWEIQPVCYMTLNDIQCSKTLPITVYKIPDQVSISIVNHIGPMTEGKKYDLQCDIQNFAPVNVLAVFWYKGSILMKNRGFSDLPTKTPSNKTVTLKFTASRDEGEAQYRCEAKLKLNGSQSPPIVKSNLLNVAVHSKPKITCSSWSPMINTPLDSYPYNVTGNPSPTITWYRDNSPVSPSTRLSRNDSGQYQYDASNVMGIDSCITNITVEYAPTFTCPTHHEGMEHESFLDKCSVMASPAADITWEKDGKLVKPLDDLTRGDTGSYLITAVNKHGTERHDLIINVLYGPRIKPDNPLEVVKEGRDMSLNCNAEGNPEPEVRWSFQNHIKATGRRQTVLTISEASLADAGVYTCTATNDHGNDTRTVSLTVEGLCPIKIQPVKLVVEFQASASANCSTTIDHLGMGWEASQGAVEPMREVQNITWRVESLTNWDIKPFCFINVNSSRQCSLKLSVTVYKRPDRVSIRTVNPTGPMIEGREYELQCDVQNVAPVHLLTVNWYKGQRLVKTESFSDETKFPSNKTTTLQISPSRDDDDGVQYRCEAELNLGPEGPQPRPKVTSDPLNITVYYKPVISCSSWSPMINTRLDSYPYNVTGNPSPKITWYRDNSPVSPSTRLSRNDSGQYQYVASNVMGIDSCITNITVEYAPTFTCPTHHEGMEHESFLDKCSVMASPAADITWEKDGKIVNPLHHLTRGDTGSYLITAVNKHGTERHGLIINVLYRPEIQLDKPSQEVTVGNDVSLSCTAVGNPDPEVTWSFQNQSKTTGKRQITFKIPKATAAHAGEYTCTASNKYGSDKRTATLTVQESHLRTVIICIVLLLLVLFIIVYVIFKWVKHRRSGTYNIQSNGAVSMALLNQNDGKDATTNIEFKS